MPSKHSRSRSPSYEHKRRRETERPLNVSDITEEDYFLKMHEFQSWLKSTRGRYFDELSGEKARHYFRKFVKAWNRGDLPQALYQGLSGPSAPQTSYKWQFAKAASESDRKQSKSAKDAVNSETYRGRPAGRVIGPSMPSGSDLQLAKEQTEELVALDRQAARRRDQVERRERVEELVGPKESGREGMLEKKKVQRENNKSFTDAKDDGGMEFNDDDLMGGGDSFKARIARRDANRRKFEEKKRSERGAQTVDARERTAAMREKDKATMDMFKALAKERFG